MMGHAHTPSHGDGFTQKEQKKNEMEYDTS
jgi:hypothetical protein